MLKYVGTMALALLFADVAPAQDAGAPSCDDIETAQGVMDCFVSGLTIDDQEVLSIYRDEVSDYSDAKKLQIEKGLDSLGENSQACQEAGEAESDLSYGVAMDDDTVETVAAKIERYSNRLQDCFGEIETYFTEQGLEDTVDAYRAYADDASASANYTLGRLAP